MRTPTEKEKGDFKQVGGVSTLGLFLRKMAEVEARYTKEHNPFDMPCARMDFKDNMEKLEKESERRYGYVDTKYVSDGIAKFDLEKYGDMGRFELISDDEDMTDRVIEGTRTQVVIGHTLKYKCGERGHGISVFYPIADYLERFGPKKKAVKEIKEE